MNDILVLEIKSKFDYENTIRLFKGICELEFEKEKEPSTYPCAMLQKCSSLHSSEKRLVIFDYNTIFAKNITMKCKKYSGFAPLYSLISENAGFFQVYANNSRTDENYRLCNRKKCYVFDEIHSLENEPVKPITVKGVEEYIGLEQFGSSINANFFNILRLNNKCDSFIEKENNPNTDFLFNFQ